MEQTIQKFRDISGNDNINHSENIRSLLKPIKYSLIDLFVSIAKVIFCWLPGGDIAKGQALMLIHFFGGCALYTFYFFLAPRSATRLFIFFFFIAVIVQQIVFRGCVITKAEQKLMGSDDTIMDPWIRLVGYTPTRETRIVCSTGVVGSMSLTLLMNTILEQII
jgi:hypothetical protein